MGEMVLVTLYSIIIFSMKKDFLKQDFGRGPVAAENTAAALFSGDGHKNPKQDIKKWLRLAAFHEYLLAKL